MKVLATRAAQGVRSSDCRKQDSTAGEGYRVRSAQDGREALASMREGDAPSLVLLDLMTPVMDGFTVIAEMKADPALADIPVIVIRAGLDALYAAGVEFLVKPLDLKTLLASNGRRWSA
jgi:CheY-like chemotaxis protein